MMWYGKKYNRGSGPSKLSNDCPHVYCENNQFYRKSDNQKLISTNVEFSSLFPQKEKELSHNNIVQKIISFFK